MKKLSLVLLIGVVFLSGCKMMETVPESDKVYEEIMDFPNKSKKQIYIQANQWFVENFNSAESVIEFQDKESGEIIGKYVVDYKITHGMWGSDYYKSKQVVSISIKEGKLRLKIYNPYYKYSHNSLNGKSTHSRSYSSKINKKHMEQIKLGWVRLSESLKVKMGGSNNENW